MCGRFALTTDVERLRAAFRLPAGAPPADGSIPLLPRNLSQPRLNISPTQPVLAVAAQADGRALTVASWGYPAASLVINARAETVDQKPLFRPHLAHGRVAVPATVWYEWRTTGGPKRPYRLGRLDDAPLAMAGLLRPNPDQPDAPPQLVLLTQPAAQPLAWLHPRMPLLLDEDALAHWLDPQTTPGAVLAHPPNLAPLLGWAPTNPRLTGEPDLPTAWAPEPPGLFGGGQVPPLAQTPPTG